MAFISSDDEGEPQHDPSDADEVYDSGPPSEGLSTPTREPALDAEPSGTLVVCLLNSFTDPSILSRWVPFPARIRALARGQSCAGCSSCGRCP